MMEGAAKSFEWSSAVALYRPLCYLSWIVAWFFQTPNMYTNPTDTYRRQIQRKLQAGNATEHTHRPALTERRYKKPLLRVS